MSSSFQPSEKEGYCTISFDNDDEMDKAFFELVHHSNEGFSGVSENGITISKKQCDMLYHKNIKYNHIEESLSATT